MASKKQLSKAEITQYARVFIEALRTGDQLADFSREFSKETASTRRDVLEAVCERVKSGPLIEIDAGRLAGLLEMILIAGTGQKPDFIERYYRELFACASALSGKSSDMVCKRLFMRLVSQGAGKEPGAESRLVTPATMTALSNSAGVVRGLSAALCDEKLCKNLNDEFDIWSVMIPELSVRGIGKIGLSVEALSGLLKIIARRQSLASSIKLSLPVITGSAEIIPDEFRSSIYSNLNLAIFNTSSGAEELRVNPSEQKPSRLAEFSALKESFASKDVSKLSDGIKNLLNELDAGIGLRMSNLTDEIRRNQKELDEIRKELAEREKEINSMSIQKSRLLKDAEQNVIELEAVKNELASARNELNNYVQSHDSLVQSSGNIERDVADRMKREFAGHAGTVLSDIRNYLDQLLKKSDIESARLAVSSFNRLARILQNQNFVPANLLPKIDDQGQTKGTK